MSQEMVATTCNKLVQISALIHEAIISMNNGGTLFPIKVRRYMEEIQDRMKKVHFEQYLDDKNFETDWIKYNQHLLTIIPILVPEASDILASVAIAETIVVQSFVFTDGTRSTLFVVFFALLCLLFFVFCF